MQQLARVGDPPRIERIAHLEEQRDREQHRREQAGPERADEEAQAQSARLRAHEKIRPEQPGPGRPELIAEQELLERAQHQERPEGDRGRRRDPVVIVLVIFAIQLVDCVRAGALRVRRAGAASRAGASCKLFEMLVILQ